MSSFVVAYDVARVQHDGVNEVCAAANDRVFTNSRTSSVELMRLGLARHDIEGKHADEAAISTLVAPIGFLQATATIDCAAALPGTRFGSSSRAIRVAFAIFARGLVL